MRIDELESRLIEVNAEKLIQRLDRLASSGEYDDVAIVFESHHLVYSWEKNRLLKVRSIMQQGNLPILAFIAVTRRKPITDIRIWHKSWDVTAEPEDEGHYRNLMSEVNEVLRIRSSEDWIGEMSPVT